MITGTLGITGLGQTPINTIASTIQTVEGYYPGTYAYTNNNPGNLIFVGQTGATLGAGGFAAFPSYDAGYQALVNQIQIYANQGLTIDQMMNKYAPAGDGSNNPTAYAQTIATALGVSTDTTVADALAGNAMAGVATADASMIPDTDMITTAFSDLSAAISAGDFSGVTVTDWSVILGGVVLIFVGGWALSRA